MLTTVKYNIYEYSIKLSDKVFIKYKFNFNMYNKYRKTLRNNLSYCTPNYKIKDHPLIGVKFQKPNNEIMIIESVSKQWFFGYYEEAIYRNINKKDSYGTCVMKNISSIHPNIITLSKNFNLFLKLEN